MTLTPTQLDRYKRHILLKEIGGAGQQALLRARVLIVGMGGLGNPLAQYLAAAGVGTLGLVDDDCVDLSNLQRQILFGTQDIGARKVDVAAAHLTALNPDVEIVCHPVRVTDENIDALIGQYDVIADGCDNFATRYIVNDACFRARKTLVSGAVGQFDGQVATFKPWLVDENNVPLPCYRSLVPSAPDADEGQDENGENCATLGTVGALAGIIGSLQALEIIKEITGSGDSLAGKVLIFDGLAGHARTVKLAWDPANPLNGTATGS